MLAKSCWPAIRLLFGVLPVFVLSLGFKTRHLVRSYFYPAISFAAVPYRLVVLSLLEVMSSFFCALRFFLYLSFSFSVVILVFPSLVCFFFHHITLSSNLLMNTWFSNTLPVKDLQREP
jgi:hypothetical protein